MFRSTALPALSVLLLSLGACVPSAQVTPARPIDVPAGDAALIANATSAAPEAIARTATVIASDSKGQMRTVRKGSGEFTCFPDDPTTPGNAPMCFDQAGLAWAQAWMSNQSPAPNLPIGIAYMLQSSWTQSNADPHAATVPGTPGVQTGPALMILNTRGMLQGHPREPTNPGQPFVMWPGTPYEHLMVPVAASARLTDVHPIGSTKQQENRMPQQILQVNLKFSIPRADLAAAWLDVAQPIADLPGLRWKVWLMNEAENEAGGIYLFESKAAAESYMAGPIVAALKSSPAISNITAKLFDVMGDHSAITRGPLNQALS